MSEDTGVDPLATRPSLLERIRDPLDAESWQEFYSLYAAMVKRFALRHGLSETEARDVVQETFISMARSMPSFQYRPTRGSFRSWMMRTTQWRIYDHFRKRGPLAVFDVPHGSSDDGTGVLDRIPDESVGNMESVWKLEWQRGLVGMALQRIKSEITPRQFQVFDLYVLKEWPVLKVARTLGVSVGHVYLVKHRISKLIKAKIRELGQNTAS